MQFKLTQTKSGVRVVNEFGADYTIESYITRGYMMQCVCGSPKWNKLTPTEYEEVVKLNKDKRCQFGRVKKLR